MMITANKLSYSRFLSTLRQLLLQSGIAPGRKLVKNELEQEIRAFSPLPQQDLSQRIGRVIIYMEEHLTEQLSLESLADEVQLSKYQLIRGFRDEEGTTPWKFLVYKRIEQAKKLLKDGIAPSQVAVETGFYDQSHLHKTFREVTGCTPKEYQENNFTLDYS